MKKILDSLYNRFFKKPEEMTLLELVRYGNRLNKKRYVKACLDPLFENLFARILAPHYKTLDLSDIERFDTVKEDLINGVVGYLTEAVANEGWGIKEACEILRYFNRTFGWHSLEVGYGVEINGIWDVVVGAMVVFIADEENGHLENIVYEILKILKAENQQMVENPQEGEIE